MHGEKPTAYFLGLERRRSKENTVTSLLTEPGRTITNNQEILQFEREYFSKIYSEDPTQMDPVEQLPVTQEDVPMIWELHKLRINRPFTIQEFYDALKDLNKNKSPGSDGLTLEFYLAFWELLKDDYMACMEYCLEQGTLSEQQRVGIITLIPKKGLERNLLSNWRPITLLNSDMKILSKALAKRLQSCVGKVISPDQTGFLRGRNIGTNLLNIQSIIDYMDASQEEGILLALDYSKAFDTVRWQLIYKALSMFGFGEFVVSVVKTLFSNISTRVSNSGFASSPFYPARGIRQGCCSSPILFVLTVELLAIAVRKSIHIRGIQVVDKEARISQYADDSTFFLKDPQALHHLLTLLDRFSRLSGLVMNRRKSHLLLLGNYRDPPTSIGGIMVLDSVKILGMIYKSSMSEEEQYSLNFAPRLAKIKQICDTWSNKSMSLKGKVTLLNTLMISILQFPCSATYTPTRVIFEFKKLAMEFLWNGGRSKTAYDLLIQQIERGGLGLPDLETSIQTTQLSLIRRAWVDPSAIWAVTLAHAAGALSIQDTLLSKMKIKNRSMRDLTPLGRYSIPGGSSTTMTQKRNRKFKRNPYGTTTKFSLTRNRFSGRHGNEREYDVSTTFIIRLNPASSRTLSSPWRPGWSAPSSKFSNFIPPFRLTGKE